jgi:hypothetical protein
MMSSNQLVPGIGPASDDKALLPTCLEEDEESDNEGSDSDIDCFTTISLDAPEVSGPTGFKDVEGMELGFGGSPEGIELGLHQIAEGTLDDECLDVGDVDPVKHPKPPKVRSIAHNILTDGSAVFLLMDIEVHGEYAGIVQLSAEIVWMKLVAGQGVAHD